MTVWVLVYGRWDDVLGKAVFSTQERAEAEAHRITLERQYWCDVEAMRIDEWCES